MTSVPVPSSPNEKCFSPRAGCLQGAGRAFSRTCLRDSGTSASLPCAAVLLPPVPSARAAGVQSPHALRRRTERAGPGAHSPVCVPGSPQALRVGGGGREGKGLRVLTSRQNQETVCHRSQESIFYRCGECGDRKRGKSENRDSLGFSEESSGLGPDWSDCRQGLGCLPAGLPYFCGMRARPEWQREGPEQAPSLPLPLSP